MAILSILGQVLPTIDKALGLIPDTNARAQAAEEIHRAMIDLDKSVAEQQAQITLKQAEHPSLFVAGPRPFIMWVGACSLLWACVLQPILEFLAALCGATITFPEVDTGPLVTILTATLGLGAYRSYDKLKQTDTKTIKEL